MFVYGFELSGNFLSYVKVEILAHDANFLSPTNGQLIISEVLDSFAQEIGTINPCDKRLSLITKFHCSFDGVSKLIGREDAHTQLEYLPPLEQDILTPSR